MVGGASGGGTTTTTVVRHCTPTHNTNRSSTHHSLLRTGMSGPLRPRGVIPIGRLAVQDAAGSAGAPCGVRRSPETAPRRSAPAAAAAEPPNPALLPPARRHHQRRQRSPSSRQASCGCERGRLTRPDVAYQPNAPPPPLHPCYQHVRRRDTKQTKREKPPPPAARPVTPTSPPGDRAALNCRPVQPPPRDVSTAQRWT